MHPKLCNLQFSRIFVMSAHSIVGDVLAAARSHLGSNSPQDYYSLPRCRFATSRTSRNLPSPWGGRWICKAKTDEGYSHFIRVSQYVFTHHRRGDLQIARVPCYVRIFSLLMYYLYFFRKKSTKNALSRGLFRDPLNKPPTTSRGLPAPW